MKNINGKNIHQQIKWMMEADINYASSVGVFRAGLSQTHGFLKALYVCGVITSEEVLDYMDEFKEALKQVAVVF